MLAHAFLAVATAVERDITPTPNGLTALTVNEFRRLFDALLITTAHILDVAVGAPVMIGRAEEPCPGQAFCDAFAVPVVIDKGVCHVIRPQAGTFA
jgi:hypothetical protein